jgi:Rps23 Pro-64 3,4-dihydroxylase Tpa1-like proline 4-hydroxylase
MQFSTGLDFPAIQRDYQIDNRIRIQNVLTEDGANELGHYLHNSVTYQNVYHRDGQNKLLSHQQIAMMSQQQKQSFFNSLYDNAAKGIGFYYGKKEITLDEPAKSICRQTLGWLNSDGTLEKIRLITGHQDIISASAQATCYTRGQFLTHHYDTNLVEKRRVAYVLSMTPVWHPDWGGLLQFFQPDGTPRDSWSPLFNSLTLFDVEHLHSVTYVTPFAMQPRISVTGWFRAEPLE